MADYLTPDRGESAINQWAYDAVDLALRLANICTLVCLRHERRTSIIRLSDPFVTRRRPFMNRLGLGLTALLLIGLLASAQNNKETPGGDASAVRSTVTNYIEAYYTGNAARMEQTLHPHYLKHKIHGDIPVREETGADLVQAARSGEGAHLAQAERKEQITVDSWLRRGSRALVGSVPVERIVIVHVAEHELLQVRRVGGKHSRLSFHDFMIDHKVAVRDLLIDPGIIELHKLQDLVLIVHDELVDPMRLSQTHADVGVTLVGFAGKPFYVRSWSRVDKARRHLHAGRGLLNMHLGKFV